MNRKSGPVGRATRHRAADISTPVRSPPTDAKSRYRVECWKRATCSFVQYQTYDDLETAERVVAQLRWVGATVRIVNA